MKATSVQVDAVRPEPSDSRQLEFLRNDRVVPVEEHYFIVKVFLDQPLSPSAEAPRLFVGDEEVAKYHGFDGGVFFKIYDPSFLVRHKDHPISFDFDDVRVDTGVKLPGPPTTSPAPPAGGLICGSRSRAPTSHQDGSSSPVGRTTGIGPKRTGITRL